MAKLMRFVAWTLFSGFLALAGMSILNSESGYVLIYLFAHSGSAAWLFSIGLLFVCLGPALIFVWAIIKGQKEAVFGSILAPVLVFAVAFALPVVGQRQTEAFLNHEVATPTVLTDTIVLESKDDCASRDCMEIVLESQFRVATKHGDDDIWLVHEAGDLTACHRDENLRSALELLRHGAAGRCIVSTHKERIGAVLVYHRTDDPSPNAPTGFEGTRHELWERSPDEERLLVMGLNGKIKTWPWFDLLRILSTANAEHISRYDSLQAILNAALSLNLNGGIDVEPRFDRAQIAEFLARNVLHSDKAVRYSAIKQLKRLQLRDDGSEDGNLTGARVDIAERLLPMLRSREQQSVTVALSALDLLGPEMVSTLRGELVDLGFEEWLLTANPDAARYLRRYLAKSSEAYSANVRRAAKATLTRPDRPYKERARLAAALLLAGGPEQRNDTVHYIIGLPSPRFEEALIDLSGQLGQWSESEMTALISRVPTVKSENFWKYLRLIEKQSGKSGQKEELIAALKERRDTSTDPNEINYLKRRIQSISSRL